MPVLIRENHTLLRSPGIEVPFRASLKGCGSTIFPHPATEAGQGPVRRTPVSRLSRPGWVGMSLLPCHAKGNSVYTRRDMRGIFCTKDLTTGIDGGPVSARSLLRDLIPGCNIFCLDQVHSGRVVLAEDLAPFETPRADGIISRDTGAVLCVRTADCVPVLAWARDMPLNAAVHAGWRGLAQGIVATCIRMMRSLGARDIGAGIGPSIGPCCYEVGREVVGALGAEPFVRSDGSLAVDLRETARSQLQDSGVSGNAIEMYDFCTACNTGRFFSYRRQGKQAGRNLALIGGKSWSLPGLPVG